ncbi:LacI family DNA-binding transcriptional regulator [Actinopolymorpha alba]|uniref:LacI family DNA-binding transcriptional regulator n=1 Tax=Actinopolymorpha alba TaxID=533267 RepID=UPI0003649B87|nr:LacI family DNA-binding transcriptional regulator [Actinopolymorpha alba]
MPETEAPRGTPTIREVADAAGVSRATVSRAFSRPELLKPSTVEHVQAIAGRLGYTPNVAARALSTGRYATLALVVPDIANPFFPPLVRGAQQAADQAGYCVFLGDSDESPAREDVLLGRFAGQVEGIVSASSRLAAQVVRRHADRRPVVLVNRDIKGIPRVLIDTASGITAAVAHLAELGHRRIAYVSGPQTSWSNQQRRRAIQRASSASGLELVTVAARRPTYDSGVARVLDLLASGVTGVVAFDDVVAQGILAGLATAGVSVPDQLSVIGCDDVVAATTSPPLTTVSARTDEAGRFAVELLLRVLGSSDVRDARYVLDTRLIVRATTGPAAKIASRSANRTTSGGGRAMQAGRKIFGS